MSKKSGLFAVSAEDKKMLDAIYWRSFNVFAGSAGFHKAGGPGFQWSVMPALVRWYPNKEDLGKALTRHNVWYNITQNVGTFAMGLVASMEREAALDPNYDTETIVALKTSLMGPMSGIGDAIFWGVVRVVAAGIALSMVGNGSILAPIMFLIVYNVPSFICRYYMTYLGYKVGSDFLTEMAEGGIMKVVTKAASTVGLFMVGGMTASNVSFTLNLAIKLTDGAEPVQLQQYFDELFLGILPLGITLFCMKLANKGVNINLITLGILVFSIICAMLGI